MIFLDGLKIAEYRSFKDEITLANLSKINILIGQNNSGKSNVLRFLSRYIPNISGNNSPLPIDAVNDRPKHNINSLIYGAIAIKKDGMVYDTILRTLPPNSKSTLDTALYYNNDTLWYRFDEISPSNFELDEQTIEKMLPYVQYDSHFALHISNMLGIAGNIRPLLKHLRPRNFVPLKVDIIPAARSLRDYTSPHLVQEAHGYTNDGIRDHGGIGLIKELYQIQNPKLGNEASKERFDNINEFLRTITENQSIQLEIPYDQSSIYVNMDGKRLDIQSLGTGIEQVLIIAAKSTLFSKQIVCIEEPEIYLHPTLQRKLIHYLNDKTDNQYFIATHSAHFLDAVPASIYHLKLEDGYSKVLTAINDKQRFTACADLGYKASDLLQANSIIWVEGPSDRVYLKHWIRSFDTELKENLHYTIMFYGGRLLSHLSVDDEAIDDFISLQKLNRNSAILIDSDKKNNSLKLNNTKLRIVDEFKMNNQFAWVTAGKEIENYLPSEKVKAAIQICHSKAKTFTAFDKYDDATVFWTDSTKLEKNKRSIDKLKVAHELVKTQADYKILDLEKKIKELCKFIRSANLMKV